MRPLLVAVLLVVSACSTRSVQLTRVSQAARGPAATLQAMTRVPTWYVDPPRDSNYVVVAATAVSADMPLALERAELDGRTQLAAELDATFGTIAQRIQREITQTDSGAVAEEFTRLYRDALTRSLQTSRARLRHAEPDGNGVRAWVLLEMPIATVNAEVVRVARVNERLAAQIVGSTAFRDLERGSRR